MLIDKIISSTVSAKLAGVDGAGAVSGIAGISTGFPELVSRALQDVADAGHRSDLQARSVALGRSNIVDVVTAVAESETALQTLVAVRDRVVSAYEEVMRMQV